LDLLWPFFERLPKAFSDKAGMFLKNTLRHLAALGRSPSQQLQERLALHAKLTPQPLQYTELSARELSKQHWKEEERALGSDHPSTLAAMRAHALQLKQDGLFSEASHLLERVVEKKRRILGEAHPETLAALGEVADVYLTLGYHQQARQLRDEIRAAATSADPLPPGPGPEPPPPPPPPPPLWLFLAGLVLLLAGMALIARC
jgi:hypothetical protein